MKKLRVLVLSLSILLGNSVCASADIAVKEGSIIKHESKASNESILEKVEIDKPIIIQFENKLNTKNNNGVYVYEKDGEKPVDVNISFGEDEKELIITPKNDFKYDTEYIIFIVNLKYKYNGLSAFNMYNFKTQSEVEKKENDKEIADKEKSNDDIFKQPGVEKYLSTEYVSIENGIVYLSQNSSAEDAIRHYKPESVYMDDINTPVYNLLKSRLEDNERENYTKAIYLKGRRDNYCDVYISLAESRRIAYPLYEIHLEEKNIKKDINPYEAPIWIRFNRLGDTRTENSLYDEYYVKRLEKDLKALYGDIGGEICEFLVGEYNYRYKIRKEYLKGNRSKESLPFIHTKRFENIEVYSELASNNKLYFYFVEKHEGDK